MTNPTTPEQTATPSMSRYERGEKALADIDGKAGQNVIDALADIAPDFARYLIEFPFGDIYSRPGLGLREREIATIAALCAGFSPAARQWPTSSVSPKLGRATWSASSTAAPVDGTMNQRVFSSVGLNSSDTFTSGAASQTC